MATKADSRAFTLIELMLAIAVIGILTLIAIPKMATLIARAREGATKGNLGAIRSALSIYYADTQGLYPGWPFPWSAAAGYQTLLQDSLVPKYIDKIPDAMPGFHHRASNRVFHVWNYAGPGEDPSLDLGDGWKYDANKWDTMKPPEFQGWFGKITVLCGHQDTKGSYWSSY